MKHVHCFMTDFGSVHVAEEGGAITEVTLPGEKAPEGEMSKTPLLEMTATQMFEYLKGERQVFTVPLEPHGSDFALKVWKEMLTIPYGKVCTYGEMAEAIGHPGAARAVGQACNRNPISILIPCHRVVGAGGKLTGYAGGLALKERLLELERNALL